MCQNRYRHIVDLFAPTVEVPASRKWASRAPSPHDKTCFPPCRHRRAALVYPGEYIVSVAQRGGRKDLGRQRFPRVPRQRRIIAPGGGRPWTHLRLSMATLWGRLRGRLDRLHGPRRRSTRQYHPLPSYESVRPADDPDGVEPARPTDYGFAALSHVCSVLRVISKAGTDVGGGRRKQSERKPPLSNVSTVLRYGSRRTV